MSITVTGSASVMPELDWPAGIPGERIVAAHGLEIWVHGQAGWHIELATDLVGLEYGLGADFYPLTKPLTGETDQGETLAVRLARILPWEEAGTYQGAFDIRCLTGVALVTLQRATGIYILPLASSDFVLIWDDHVISLNQDEWIFFAPTQYTTLAVEWLGKRVFSSGNLDGQALQLADVYREPAVLMWSATSFSAQVGQVFSVELRVDQVRLQDPIVFGFSDSLLPIGTWEVNGVQFAWQHRDGDYVLQEDLGAGPYVLRGQVLPLVYRHPSKGWIQASLGAHSARLYGHIESGWFGGEGLVILRVSAEGNPVRQHHFLVPPHNQVRTTDAQGILTISLPPGVWSIVSHDERVDPRWVVVQSHQIQIVDIEVANNEQYQGREPTDSFAVWDFTWEQGFTWNFHLETPRLKLMFAERDANTSLHFQGDGVQARYAGREAQAGETLVTFTSRVPKAVENYRLGDWQWIGRAGQWQGRLESGKWSFTTGLNPDHSQWDFSLSNGDGRMFVQLPQKRAGFSLKKDHFTAGLEYEDSDGIQWWMRDTSEHWRIQQRAKRYQIQIRSQWWEYPLTWQLDWENLRRWDFQLSLDHEEDKAVLQLVRDQRDVTVFGLWQRYMQLASGGFSLSVASQYRSQVLQSEVICRKHVALTDASALYLQWKGQWAGTRFGQITSLDFLWSPHRVGYLKLGWQSDAGFHWQGGLTFVRWP